MFSKILGITLFALGLSCLVAWAVAHPDNSTESLVALVIYGFAALGLTLGGVVTLLKDVRRRDGQVDIGRRRPLRRV